MAYCQHCGTNLDTNPNFCPNCGAQLNDATPDQATFQQQGNSRQWSNTAKTVGTVAGVAVGASVLGGLLRRRRRRPPMPPHGGFMGGHGRHGHGGHGPMGGPGGPMGGPGGPR